MGPKLISHTSKKTDIKYSIRILPFGGYVAMVGEDDDGDGDERALCKKAIWKRIIITAAGSAMNIILGIILTFVMVLSLPKIGFNEIASFDTNSVSQSYGLQIGDKIEKIGTKSVHTSYEVAYEIAHSGTKALDITVDRNGEKKTISGIKFGIETDEGVDFGIMDFYISSSPKTASNIIKQSFYNTGLSVRMIWESLIDFVSGKYSMDALSGPVGLTSTISTVASRDIVSLIYLCSVIALNLGIFNLLPIPALDGGRIFFQLFELVFRKPINKKIERAIHLAGIIILFGFMIIISFKDIIKLIG